MYDGRVRRPSDKATKKSTDKVPDLATVGPTDSSTEKVHGEVPYTVLEKPTDKVPDTPTPTDKPTEKVADEVLDTPTDKLDNPTMVDEDTLSVCRCVL